ncbi:gliding motility-associated C-terminal domain-containing protein [Ferruginibacter sp. SUN106]|uniref:T9SS type B sorting domain-containing protein n=1 Tax=Ferruginibacter sp. SUN106 TaxID=2978348 RepID=UPI003D35D101
MGKKTLILLFFVFALVTKDYGQNCSLPGMTPDKAYPVCGTSVFHEDNVTNCTGPDVAGAGCTVPVTSSSSFWYKFTCYQGGTLGFLMSGINPDDDYDWELFDVTGRNPTDVYTDGSLRVSLNIYGAPAGVRTPFPNSPTGCRAGDIGNVHCEGNASGNTPFNAMPTITVGHDYLLMVTNWTKSTSGYDLSFTGGTASITDPKEPHLQSSRAICDGTQAVIKLNKRMKCSSLSSNGSEFTITPPVANVIAAVGYGCSTGFDMDSVILTLNNPLPPGNYTITIKNGTPDGNTLKDNCDRLIPVGENIPMVVYPVFPTPMDSLTKPGCAPDELFLDFSKQLRLIRCNSIAADGSDFRVTMLSGTTPVTVIGASGVCSADGLTPVIKVKLSAPIQTKGTYQIILQRGITDNNTIINECGQETPAGATLNFETKDTVNADFTYSLNLGCKRDTINYFHDGRNEVNLWKWNFDNIRTSGLQNPSMVYATFGNKTAQLIVSNGVCKDTSAIKTILLDNDLKAEFEATAVVCPGDLASYKESSIGKIVSWYWDFGNGNTSLLQQPPQQTYPFSTSIRNVPVQLIVTNNLGCKDTAVETIKVVGNCYIAVPNAFTPNQDGMNDYLYPLNAYKAKDLIFKVYNRFGQLIFSTTDWTNKWDGTFKGQGADAGTYVWLLQYTHVDTGKRIEQKGTTILIR